MSRRRRKPIPKDLKTLQIEKLSHEGRGITKLEGKTIFVEGALPGETVTAEYVAVHNQYDEMRVKEVLVASIERVQPDCQFVDRCGGCRLQHMAPSAQIALKESILEEQFEHIGQVNPQTWLEPMTALSQGYRKKARLGVKFVTKKDKCLVGFREKQGRFLAEIDTCTILHIKVSKLLEPLQKMIATMDAKLTIPQIEVAMGDEQLAFIVRHLKALSEDDTTQWITFAKKHDIQLYFQPKGPDTVHKVWPEDNYERLSYCLPEFDLELLFHPLDFTQINSEINQKMVALAIHLLEPQSNERVLDLFCGLGNFTLPLATRSKEVVGVEGVDAMVKRGYENAQHNGIEQVHFYQTDLQKDFSDEPWASQGFDKILIDPPRSGALDVVNYIHKFNARKIVYVSCNPATLARDAGVLKTQGYQLTQSGVMDMFPHTAHVESIAVFEK